MKRRFLPSGFLAIVTIIIFNWGCTKIDTTTLGSDLLPVVDNINTFSTTIDIVSYPGIFDDTTSLAREDDQVLGKITTDPVFGKTQATMFFQLKPSVFPYQIQPAVDSLVGVDSIYLCIAFKSAWGDTAQIQKITVKEIPTTAGDWDNDTSIIQRKISYAPVEPPVLAGLPVIGTSFVDIRTLGQKLYFNRGKDSVINQIRIKLSQDFVDKFSKQDSAAVTRPGYVGNAFYNDANYRSTFEGFAVESAIGEALMTVSLNNQNTRLEIHYRKKKLGTTTLDTTMSALFLVTAATPKGSTPATKGTVSSVANNVLRDYTGSEVLPVNVPRVSKPAIYLQTAPGTFTDLVLDSLESFNDTNRIIHLAKLTISEIADPATQSNKFTPPNFLYLDLKESQFPLRHKPVYIDLNPIIRYYPDNDGGFYFPMNLVGNEAVDFSYFGGYAKKKIDPNGSGIQITYYDFNLTRYIQQMVMANSRNYELRVFAPYHFSYPQYATPPYPARLLGYPNNIGYGRVKVGGSTNLNPAYGMKMVIVWSKVKQP